jgi:hypothetical protein
MSGHKIQVKELVDSFDTDGFGKATPKVNLGPIVRAWIQEANSDVTTEFARRGNAVLHNVYVMSDPGIGENAKLDLIFSPSLKREGVVRAVRNFAGLKKGSKKLYRIIVEEERVGQS